MNHKQVVSHKDEFCGQELGVAKPSRKNGSSLFGMGYNSGISICEHLAYRRKPSR